MRIVWVIVGGLVGAVVGAVAGFGVALALAKPRNDGSFGMREILVCLPSGAALGLMAGVTWGLRTAWGQS